SSASDREDSATETYRRWLRTGNFSSGACFREPGLSSSEPMPRRDRLPYSFFLLYCSDLGDR
ncbi:MAG: hypothetical protein AAFY15_11960, partial [Cyanobacteria bacterium J06648_11]